MDPLPSSEAFRTLVKTHSRYGIIIFFLLLFVDFWLSNCCFSIFSCCSCSILVFSFLFRLEAPLINAIDLLRLSFNGNGISFLGRFILISIEFSFSFSFSFSFCLTGPELCTLLFHASTLITFLKTKRLLLIFLHSRLPMLFISCFSNFSLPARSINWKVQYSAGISLSLPLIFLLLLLLIGLMGLGFFIRRLKTQCPRVL
mmetsp:Transcript_106266/g.228974  ORF Transcript_106266/g.228974 Transcript_106266/m.228974 type:complete len:201 (+) Transcript_106266:630-1232(+)